MEDDIMLLTFILIYLFTSIALFITDVATSKINPKRFNTYLSNFTLSCAMLVVYVIL